MIPSAPFRPARRRLLSQGNLAAKDSLAEHLKQKLRASLKIITLKKKERNFYNETGHRTLLSHIQKARPREGFGFGAFSLGSG